MRYFGSGGITVDGGDSVGVGGLRGVRDGTGVSFEDTLLIMRDQVVKLVNLQLSKCQIINQLR